MSYYKEHDFRNTELYKKISSKSQFSLHCWVKKKSCAEIYFFLLRFDLLYIFLNKKHKLSYILLLLNRYIKKREKKNTKFI